MYSHRIFLKCHLITQKSVSRVLGNSFFPLLVFVYFSLVSRWCNLFYQQERLLSFIRRNLFDRNCRNFRETAFFIFFTQNSLLFKKQSLSLFHNFFRLFQFTKIYPNNFRPRESFSLSENHLELYNNSPILKTNFIS